MITSITQDSKTYYLHTAWASDNKGTGFTLTYDADLYTGTFVDQSSAENSDYNAYTWQCADNDETTTLDSVAADLANLSDRIIGTQDTTDQKLPGVNMAALANTSLSAWTLTNCTAELIGNGIKLTATADGAVTASFKTLMEMVQTGAYTLSLGCISPAEITASITDAGASLGILASISASANWINYVSTIDAVSDSSSQTIAFSFTATAGQTVSLDYIKFEAGAKSTNWDAAEQALNVADIAINAAETAQSAATTAQSAAETAQSTASTAKTAADSAATAAASAKTAAQTAKATADGISVGGRNLLLQSGVEVSNAKYVVALYTPSSPLIAGKEYTISIDITPTPTATFYGIYVSGGTSGIAFIVPSGPKRQILRKTFTAKYYQDRAPDVNPAYATIELCRFPNPDTGTTTIHSIKIESGNRATDWTPAPEDVQSGIDAAQSSADGAQNTADDVADTVNRTSISVLTAGQLTADVVSLDSAKWAAKVTSFGDYTFTYNGSAWSLSGTAVTLADYGIAVTGTVASGDAIHVSYGDSGLIEGLGSLQERLYGSGTAKGDLGEVSDSLKAAGSEISSLQGTTSSLQAAQDSTAKQAADTAASMATYKGYINIDESKPSITLGKNMDTKLVLGAEKLAFVTNGSEAASLANDQLNAPTARVTNLLLQTTDASSGESVGDLALVARSNGHLSLKKVN